MPTSIADVKSAVDALEESIHAVVGDGGNVRHYAAMSLGAFADAIDELRELGISIDRISPARVHATTSTNDVYNLIADDDNTIAQLLKGNGSWWPTIEKTLSAHIHGDVMGDDTAPSDNASKEDQLEWLRKQANRVVEAANTARDKALDIPKEELQAVRKVGRAAVQTIQKNAQALKRGAEKRFQAAADGVINTVKGAAVTAGWGAGVSIGVIAVVGLLIYASAKSGRTQKRISSQRDYFVGEARRAGVHV